jgi:Flp pilus assembly protein TadD
MTIALIVASSLVAAPQMTTAEKLTLGEGYVGRGDGKKAQPLLEAVLADPAIDDAARAKASRALGLALIQQKKPKDAVAHLVKATVLTPKDEKGWLYLGIARDQAGDTDGAVKAYADGTKAVPKSTSLAHEYGMALLSVGNNAEAATVLEAAATKSEYDPEIAADAAYALSLVGKFKPAREFALRAVEQGPENPNALYTLGMAELGLGNTKAATQAFVDAIDSDPLHLPALFQLGLLQQSGGDHVAAAKTLTQVLKIEPEHARARAALGLSLMAVGDDSKAEPLLRAATTAEPRLASAWFGLGDLLARQGKIAEAKKALQTAQKLKPSAQVKARLDSLNGVKEGTPVKAP